MKSQSQPNFRGRISATDKVYRSQALVGHLLVFACALLLAAMPWTEHYWTFDGFVLGRPDFELTLLAFLTILCLVLLLAQLGKRGVSLRLSLKIWLWFIFKRGDAGSRQPCTFLCESDARCNLDAGFGSQNQPIRV